MCRITSKASYGQHIALTCKNHPGLTWSTKNIGALWEGKLFPSRSIFYSGDVGTECNCPTSSLMLSPQYDDLPDVAE